MAPSRYPPSMRARFIAAAVAALLVSGCGGQDTRSSGQAQTAELAKKRADYIAQFTTGSGILGTEWRYFTPDGTGLIRVGGDVKPSLAKEIEAAVRQR